MTNLNVQLYINNIDFESESFETIETFEKEWEAESVKITEEEITQLFNRILINKGDWVKFHSSLSQCEVLLEIRLLITKKTLQPEDVVLIEQSKEIIESFLANIKVSYFDSIDSKMSNVFLDNSSENVGLLKVRLPGTSNSTLKDSILIDMNKMGLNPIIENVEVSIVETGASGGDLEIIYAFVGGSISSGITYDILKNLLKQIPLLKNANFTWSEELYYVKVKKKVAIRANLDKNSLFLVDFKKEDFHSYIFKSGKNYIFVKLNDLHEIVEYKLTKNRRQVKEIFYPELYE